MGPKAVEQTQKLKKILEEFFAPEFADWCFVGMIYTNDINTINIFCGRWHWQGLKVTQISRP